MALSFIEFFSTESKGLGENWFGKLNSVFKRQRSLPELRMICRLEVEVISWNKEIIEFFPKERLNILKDNA